MRPLPLAVAVLGMSAAEVQPPGGALVTVKSRIPGRAEGSTVMFALMESPLIMTMPLRRIPSPRFRLVTPSVKPLPVNNMSIVSPRYPEEGCMPERTGSGLSSILKTALIVWSSVTL